MPTNNYLPSARRLSRIEFVKYVNASSICKHNTCKNLTTALTLHRVFHGIDLRLIRLIVAMTINSFLYLSILPFPSLLRPLPEQKNLGIDKLFAIFALILRYGAYTVHLTAWHSHRSIDFSADGSYRYVGHTAYAQQGSLAGLLHRCRRCPQ